MNSRERVYKALTFDHPDRVPRDLWCVAGITMFQQEELHTVQKHFPGDLVLPVDPESEAASGDLAVNSESIVSYFEYGKSRYEQGEWFKIGGGYTDEWNSPWEVAEDGIAGEVKKPPISDWSLLDSYQLPFEIIENANWEVVNNICASTDQFVITPWHLNIFERMQALRGAQNLLMDLGYLKPDFYKFRDMLQEYFLKEIKLWCQTDVDGVRLSDDWGWQKGLLVSPKLWREIFKPLYAEYCHIIKKAGKFVFYHSDGNITDIIPDLIEIGVDALNSQLFCMDIEEIGRKYKGAITFWGEIDRQAILPFGSPEDVRRAVRRVRSALDTGKGGVIAQLEWGNKVPSENIEAAFEAWLEPFPFNRSREV